MPQCNMKQTGEALTLRRTPGGEGGDEIDTKQKSESPGEGGKLGKIPASDEFSRAGPVRGTHNFIACNPQVFAPQSPRDANRRQGDVHTEKLGRPHWGGLRNKDKGSRQT